MKNLKNIAFYVFVTALFSLFIYFIVIKGQLKENVNEMKVPTSNNQNSWVDFKSVFSHNVTDPLAVLMLQIITIIFTARIFSFLFKKIGQPSVIGEITAGIFLGPSFIGYYFPEFSHFLFPVASLSNLKFLSQIGLILFMFVVGMELDFKVLRTKAHEALVISHASIIIPFALGVGFSYFIYEKFAPAGINFLSFSLFIGIAMSITAFPVLARIIQERGISKTKLGTIAITCAAIDDITAWCALAAVIAIVKAGSFVSSLYTIALAVVYILFMLRIVQPFLKQLGDKYSSKEGLTKPIVAVFFLTLLISAFLSEIIGIHALFGAFLAGVVMPTNVTFRNIFIEKIEDVSSVLLLPLFFVFTGLRTQIGLLNDIYLWEVCGVIIVIAIVGKFWGSAIAARFVGQSWKDSFTIGALMNTRGLMELVVLNIGFDLGVLSPQIFAMMVIMALFTTFMTGPALDFTNWLFRNKEVVERPIFANLEEKYRILISYGNPVKGKAMLKLAFSLTKNSMKNSLITTMHISPSNELNKYNLAEYEKESVRPLKNEATKLKIEINTVFKPALDIDKEIIETSSSNNFDFLLIGSGNSLFTGSILGQLLGLTTKILNPKNFIDTLKDRKIHYENSMFDEHTNYILKHATIPVGVFIDKKFEQAKKIVIPIYSLSDSFLMIYAQKFIFNSNAKVTVIDSVGILHQYPELKNTFASAQSEVEILQNYTDEEAFFTGFDLCLLNIESWRNIIKEETTWLAHSPSILILKA
ncbi:MAG: cation:proton antiporter [Bacteroidota bacterium]|nr:cation:proton antiporter [Bacteroidota bacterium]